MAARPFQKLPPGVYFNPTAEECVRDYLRPWKAGVMPATDRVITDVNIYSQSPDALVQGREPGFSRGSDHKWLMLTDCVRVSGGKGKGKARAKRDVATGGHWKVEQRSKPVAGDDDAGDDDPPGGDRRRTNGFYVSSSGGNGGKKDSSAKTPWLMEELTTAEDEEEAAAGWKGDRTVQVFCKLYVSPRSSDEEKIKIFGEDGVPFDRDGNPKTAREALPEDLFDAVAASIHRAQGPPAPAPPRVLGGGCQQQQGHPARRVVAVGHQHGNGQPAAPAPRVVGLQRGVHQYGQAAVLGHHHGHAVLQRGVPAHHQHGHVNGQAAAHQIHGGFDQYCYGGPVHNPYRQFHYQASPAVAGHYYSAAAPSFHPQQQQQQGYEMIHMGKKPRLTLTHDESPPEQQQQQQQPEGDADSDKSSCVVQASTPQEPVHTPSPPQEVAGTATVAAESTTNDHSIFAELPPLIDHDTLLSEDKPPSSDELS
nr:unnamed protein product [Digitaria exilis]